MRLPGLLGKTTRWQAPSAHCRSRSPTSTFTEREIAADALLILERRVLNLCKKIPSSDSTCCRPSQHHRNRVRDAKRLAGLMSVDKIRSAHGPSLRPHLAVEFRPPSSASRNERTPTTTPIADSRFPHLRCAPLYPTTGKSIAYERVQNQPIMVKKRASKYATSNCRSWESTVG